jgi:squalene cyclase
VLGGSVRRAIDYFLDAQESDGRWVDPRWADLDTTSHPVSFFNVVLALGEGHRRVDVERSWRDGLGFILDRQTPEGGWHDADFHPSGVEITAHLIQDALVASLVLGDRVPGIRASCRKGLAALRGWQAADGSWDEENVDHTMDCVRSSMVVTRILGDDPQTAAAIERGLDWIVANKNQHGWGDFPGMETNLERTCDGIDALCKYRAFRAPDPMAVVRLWGYVP